MIECYQCKGDGYLVAPGTHNSYMCPTCRGSGLSEEVSTMLGLDMARIRSAFRQLKEQCTAERVRDVLSSLIGRYQSMCQLLEEQNMTTPFPCDEPHRPKGIAAWLAGSRIGEIARRIHQTCHDKRFYIPPLPPARLEELRGLQDGWLDGKGTAPPDEGLDWLADAFGRHFPDDLPLPFLYPTAEGGIQAEWSPKPHEITIEIDLASHKGEWHGLNMDTDVEESRDLNLDDPSDWAWIVAKVKELRPPLHGKAF